MDQQDPALRYVNLAVPFFSLDLAGRFRFLHPVDHQVGGFQYGNALLGGKTFITTFAAV
jgi:hypothetical protein